MNLIKKINTLELGMSSNEYIEIKEIWYLEKFLRDRFQFGQVHMIISYANGVYIKSIEKIHNEMKKQIVGVVYMNQEELFDKIKDLITKMANDYYKYTKELGIEFDDLYQEGC